MFEEIPPPSPTPQHRVVRVSEKGEVYLMPYLFLPRNTLVEREAEGFIVFPTFEFPKNSWNNLIFS
jgi:hypothetical protein